MGTPQKGYGDHKNRSGGVGRDRQPMYVLPLRFSIIILEYLPIAISLPSSLPLCQSFQSILCQNEQKLGCLVLLFYSANPPYLWCS
jgi:hypothetical protein